MVAPPGNSVRRACDSGNSANDEVLPQALRRPTAELRAALEANGGELRRLFNTAGRDYREQKLGEKLPGMSTAAALSLLGENGNLVKRPFLIGDGVALVGFSEKAWAAVLVDR